MSSVVSSDSVIVPDSTPIAGSRYVVDNNSDGINIDTRNSDVGLNLVIDELGNDAIYSSDESDFISTGLGNDIAHGGGGDDFIEGGDGNDYIRGGAGEDVIIGGKGADVLIGGSGFDTFIIQGDPVEGAFGPDSDLQLDAQGKVIHDEILDFNDDEDLLILQDLRVTGVGNVRYDSGTGDVILTDTVNGEVISTNVIAKLPAGLEDVEVNNLGGGNWTLL